MAELGVLEEVATPIPVAPRTRNARWQYFLCLLIATLSLSWAGIVNGGPYFFPDTSNYVRAADGAVIALFDHRSAWSDRLIISRQPQPQTGSSQPVNLGPKLQSKRTVLTGRSIYYGAFLYVMFESAGLWGALFAQAFLVAATLLVSLGILGRQFSKERPYLAGPWPPVLLIVLLSATTPLSFYTSMLMPDIYSGLMVLGLAVLMVYWPVVRPSERLFLFVLCCAAASFHQANLLIAIAIGFTGLVLRWFTGEPRWRDLAIVPVILIVAGVAGALFMFGVDRALGQSPISPPFLSARLIASGPGYHYLRDHCHRPAFALCAYLQRMPHDSDEMLWSENASNGIFSAATEFEKRRLASEDRRFYLAVIKDRPLDVARVTLMSTIKAATTFNLSDFNYDKAMRPTYREKLPGHILAQAMETRAFRQSYSLGAWELSTLFISLFSIIIILLAFVWRGRQSWENRMPATRFMLVILGAILANAAICGGLSKPHARYQMRLIWLLPIAALVGALGSLKKQTPGPFPIRAPA